MVQHREEEEEPKGAIGELVCALLLLQALPAQPQLDSAVGRGREDQAVVIVAEGDAHGGVHRLLKLTVRRVAGMEYGDQVTSVRRHCRFVASEVWPSDGRLAIRAED